MTYPTQTPVIPFTDNIANHTKPTNIKLSLQKSFSKPPKWSFVILKFLIVVLVPLLSNPPDIHINFYMINIIF